MTTTWTRLLAVSLVTMGLAHTIARERLFASLRARLGGKDTWFGYLISCPYCVSHWIAAGLVPLTATYALDVSLVPGPLASVLRWALSTVLVAVIAAFLRVIFYFVDEAQGLVRREQRSVEEEVIAHQSARRNALEQRDSEAPVGGEANDRPSVTSVGRS